MSTSLVRAQFINNFLYIRNHNCFLPRGVKSKVKTSRNVDTLRPGQREGQYHGFENLFWVMYCFFYVRWTEIRFPIIERFRKYWGNYGIGKMIMTQTMVPSYSALSDVSCRGSYTAAYTHLIENRSSMGASYTAKFWNMKMKNEHECSGTYVQYTSSDILIMSV